MSSHCEYLVRLLESTTECIQAMLDPNVGIPIASFQFGLTFYENCFRGSDAAAWFMANLKDVKSIQHAQHLGQLCLESRLFKIVRAGNTFTVSDSTLYTLPQLQTQTQTQTLPVRSNSICDSLSSALTSTDGLPESRTSSSREVCASCTPSNFSKSSGRSLSNLLRFRPLSSRSAHVRSDRVNSIHRNGPLRPSTSMPERMRPNTASMQGNSPSSFPKFSRQEGGFQRYVSRSEPCSANSTASTNSKPTRSASALRRRTSSMISFGSLLGGVLSSRDIGHRRARHPVIQLDLKDASIIHRAAAMGDVDAVRAFIRNDASYVDRGDEHNRPPLVYAIVTNQLKVCKQLLRLGAHVNHVDSSGYTPVLWAVSHGCLEVMQLLLRHGADPNVVDAQGQSCLHWSCKVQAVDILQKLLTVCDAYLLSHEDYYHQTALHWAVLCGRPIHASVLIENGIDMSIGDCQGRTALHDAIELGHLDCLRVLARACDSHTLNQRDSRGYAALHVAVSKGDMNAIHLLLNTPAANVNCIDRHGRTPLHYAALLSYPVICRALLTAGAVASVADVSGRTPLQLAIDKVCRKCTRRMILLMSAIMFYWSWIIPF